MTDLKNIIEVSFPDDGVSTLYYKCDCAYCNTVFSFFYFYFYFLFLFLVGRSPSGDKSEYKKYRIAEIPAKESKMNI